jgi:hypothetical protein
MEAMAAATSVPFFRSLAVTLLAAKVAPIILEALVMRLDDSLLLL